MCKLKSGIILKDQIFIPGYDNHTNMLKELNIEDNKTNARTLFVRAELFPKNNDIFSDISTWNFNVDQDILPEWFVYEYDKQRMIEAVKKWKNGHIFENVDNLELKGNDKYYLKNCKNVKIYDNCKIYAYNNCTINAFDNCIVNAENNCKITAYNKSTINVSYNCIVNAYDNSKIRAFIDCTVNAYNSCNIESYNNCIITVHDKCIVDAFEDSMVKAYDNCTVYVYNDNEDDDNDYAVEVKAHDDCKIINVGN